MQSSPGLPTSRRAFGSNSITVLLSLVLVTAMFGVGLTQPRQSQAAGGLDITIVAAPNLIVDSNVLSPSTKAPEVATVMGRFCNSSGSTLNGVVGYIGDYTGS